MQIKQTLTSVKNKVEENKTKILVVTTVVSTTTTVILVRANRLHNKFLTEKGLTDEYYQTDEI
jgi:hypothetical protein